VPSFEFAFVEVLPELGPLVVRRFPIFGFRSDASPLVDVRAVSTDHFVWKDSQVVLGGCQVCVSEHFGGDMNG
jgi:hypothetical protein